MSITKQLDAGEVAETMREVYDWDAVAEEVEDEDVVYVQVHPDDDVRILQGDIEREFGPGEVYTEQVDDGKVAVTPLTEARQDRERQRTLLDARDDVDDTYDNEQVREKAHEVLNAIEESGVTVARLSVRDMIHRAIRVNNVPTEGEAEVVRDAVTDLLDEAIIMESNIKEVRDMRNWVERTRYDVEFVVGEEGLLEREKGE